LSGSLPPPDTNEKGKAPVTRPLPKTSKGKGKGNATRPLDNFVCRVLTDAAREAANRRFVIWSSVNFRPQNMLTDVGFKLFVGVLAPDYVTSVMHADTYNKYLINLYIEVQNAMLTEIGVHRDACRALGYHGPFLGGQVDLTTVAGEEYITFSASYIPAGEENIRRVGLATRAFPGSHTAVDVEYWIEKVCLDVLGSRCCNCHLGFPIYMIGMLGSSDWPCASSLVLVYSTYLVL
jgi:hypothetical protein